MRREGERCRLRRGRRQEEGCEDRGQLPCWTVHRAIVPEAITALQARGGAQADSLRPMTSTASGFESTSTKRRPSWRHAAPSVPLPAKKSRHQPPGRDDAATIRRTTASGFWVGYPVFSLPVVWTIVDHHTEAGTLPRAAFSGPTRRGAMYGSRSTSAVSNQCSPRRLT